MQKNEVNVFIDTMEEFGDFWDAKQVIGVYGDYSLSEAIADRTAKLAKEMQNLAALLK